MVSFQCAKLSIVRAALTGAIALSVLCGVSWLVALVAGGAIGHMYHQLFTGAEMNMARALLEGTMWS